MQKRNKIQRKFNNSFNNFYKYFEHNVNYKFYINKLNIFKKYVNKFNSLIYENMSYKEKELYKRTMSLISIQLNNVIKFKNEEYLIDTLAGVLDVSTRQIKRSINIIK